MKIRIAIASGLLVVASAAHAATAYWTGKSEPAQSVTGAAGWNCEYSYAGQTFWRMFTGFCPSSIEIQ